MRGVGQNISLSFLDEKKVGNLAGFILVNFLAL